MNVGKIVLTEVMQFTIAAYPGFTCIFVYSFTLPAQILSDNFQPFMPKSIGVCFILANVKDCLTTIILGNVL